MGAGHILIDRRITSQDVIEQLFHLFVSRGIPERIRPDNGPDFTVRAILELAEPSRSKDAIH